MQIREIFLIEQENKNKSLNEKAQIVLDILRR